MATETIFIALFKNENSTLQVEYVPLENGAIEIVSFAIVDRPKSRFEQRKAKRRIGLVLDEQEQYAEAIRPYSIREEK